MKIAIVGPCASGTTTLAENLRQAGYDAHPVAQEHSYVPDMWRMNHPDILIYLDATMATIRSRRDVSWGEDRLAAENLRLAHARRHCHFYLSTDTLTREQVLGRVVEFLSGLQCTPRPSDSGF